MKKLILMLFLLAGQSSAQTLTDTVALRGFMDGVMTAHLRDKHIAGATVSIIKDGKVLLAQGYGFSDEAKRVPVRAEVDLFRIGSITKMFTWVSVMQLVAQGKLDLNADVNTYLKDFQIEPTFPEPITLKNLMTHTPGFEDRFVGLFGRDSSSLKPLGEILATDMPDRVRPPGTYASYSNHGTGLAAYIIEQVTGMSFNDYVEQNVLVPLGMKNTTLRQPLPADFKSRMSKGYQYSPGNFAEKSFEFVPLYPAGSASTTATDMVLFMRALLENGSLNGAKILDSATLAMMKTPAHRHDPAVNPMRHGFMDLSRGGIEVIGHGGDTFWFHSVMALFPQHNVGFFVSFNTDKGGGVYLDVLDEFMNRYFPEATPAPPLKVTREYLAQFAGKYRANRQNHSDFTTVAGLLGDFSVTVTDSTGLKVQSGERVRHIIPIDSLVFREKNSTAVVAFEKKDGAITRMFIGNLPIFTLDKVSGLKSAELHLFIAISAIVLGILTLLFWPFVALSRIGYQSQRFTKPMPFNARLVAWLNFFVLLIFYLGVASNANEEGIVYGVSSALKVFLYFPFLNILLTAGMLYWLIRVIPVRYHRTVSKLYYTLLCLVAIAALWQLYYLNMIGA
ncbi:MAG: beta-lactamase family protein [Cyclobacteriaceae bacterium]|nr:beta-lactamase family protein [Cyclobacteriaceae bacterium]